MRCSWAGAALIASTVLFFGVQADSARRSRAVSPMMVPDRIPEGTLSQLTDPTRSIGFPGLAWPQDVLTVAFNGGDPRVYPLIEAAASEWTAGGGRLRLSFKRQDGRYRLWRESDTVPASDVRIGFFTDARKGYWSAVGATARRVSAAEATMNFGELGTSLAAYYGGAKPDQWLQSYSHSVVLHEFGHALSLNHEHFHPACQADLKLQPAVAFLMGAPNRWSKKQAMFNMDAATYFAAMASQTGGAAPVMTPVIDRASVMLYSFPNAFYSTGAASPCSPSGPSHFATSLSVEDKSYFKKVYPQQ